MSILKSLSLVTSLSLLLALHQTAGAVVASQVDDFEDGTTQGWQEGGASPNPPVVTDLEAPLPGGTYSLRNQSSGGFGPGSRWAMFNTAAKWQGDYIAAGIAEIRMWVQVYPGNPQADMRVGFESSGGRLVSTESVVVPNSGDWYLVVLPIGPGDLTQVSGAGTYNSIMSDVANFRIISSVTTKWEGDSIIHEIGVDNIKALTEPSLYQGWLWSDGIFGFPPTYHEEEYCFGPVVVEIAGDDTVLLGGEEACWGRSTNNANPPRSYWGFNGITFTDVEFFDAIGSRPLVSAGGNLLEVFAFDEFDEEERAATVIAEPSDSDLLMLGGAEGDAFSGFAYVDMMVKTSPDVIASRVASDLQGRWRITFFSRVLDRTDVNVEAVAAGIQTFDLQGGGTCTFTESLVFQDPAYDTNGETFVAAQFDVDGVDLTNRGVTAELANASVTGCTYGLDQDGYLSMTFTETDDSGPSQLNFRFAVADDNNYLVWTADPDGIIEDPTSLAVAYRAPSAMNTNAIDGNYLFYLSATDYASTGTAHSSGETGFQEFDIQGRGMLSFDSNQPGTVPAGQSGSWFKCEIAMVQDGAEYQVDGQPAMFTVSTVLEIDSEYTPFTGCDYSTSADGSLLINLEVTDPNAAAEEFLFSGYVNDNGEVLSAINFVSDPAPSAGIEDSGGVRHVVAMKYTGDPAANEDGDNYTNLEEFQLPLPPPVPQFGCPLSSLPLVCDIPDADADGVGDILVLREGSVIAEIRSGSDAALIDTITFLSEAYTPITGAVLPDADGDGVAEIAVLASRNSDSRVLVEIRNVTGPQAPRQIFFAAGHTAIAMAVVNDDADDNGIPEVAVLLNRNSDGRGLAEVKNAFGPKNNQVIWAASGYDVIDVEVVDDADDNGVPEIAIMSKRTSDNRIVVQTKNAVGAANAQSIFFIDGNTAIDLVSLSDKDANGIPEIAVLSTRNSDGRNVVEIKNALGPKLPVARWFSAGNTALGVAAVPDGDGNGVPEVAVLSNRISDGRVLVEVKNAAGPVQPKQVFYSPGYSAYNLTITDDADNNGVPEAAVLMIRNSDGRILVQGRNTSGPALPKNFFFLP